VLVVENEDVLADLMRRQLESAGYHATVETSSRGALDRLRADPQQFDLVITDNNMPVLRGAELAAELLRIQPRLRLILVTGFSDALAIDAILAQGVCQVLAKPHTGQELLAAVGVALSDSSDAPVIDR
jgi:CheY-like chemotaxis protein